LDPSPVIGGPDQGLDDAAAKNGRGQPLSGRVERLAKACRADPVKVRAYARFAAWNRGVDPAELLDHARTEPG
jgi:hypothetical protein